MSDGRRRWNRIKRRGHAMLERIHAYCAETDKAEAQRKADEEVERKKSDGKPMFVRLRHLDRDRK